MSCGYPCRDGHPCQRSHWIRSSSGYCAQHDAEATIAEMRLNDAKRKREDDVTEEREAKRRKVEEDIQQRLAALEDAARSPVLPAPIIMNVTINNTFINVFAPKISQLEDDLKTMIAQELSILPPWGPNILQVDHLRLRIKNRIADLALRGDPIAWSIVQHNACPELLPQDATARPAAEKALERGLQDFITSIHVALCNLLRGSEQSFFKETFEKNYLFSEEQILTVGHPHVEMLTDE